MGFDFCGISKVEFLEVEAPRLEKWLNEGRHGQMKWMENYFDMRLDPRRLVEGARTVISLLLNYYPSRFQESKNDNYKISKYAYGEDYHLVLKKKCRELMLKLKEEIGDFHARAFTDSAPVMDKVWAQKSGLGWIGKNSNLINKGNGSFFFIAEIILDVEMEPDVSTGDFCGTCTACIDNCPTQAIVAPYVVDGSQCISYLTIELKENIPDEFAAKMDNWIFGCDVCQDVCPWNRFSKASVTQEFQPYNEIMEWKNSEWETISDEAFKKIFSRSALKRTGIEGIRRSIKFIKASGKD